MFLNICTLLVELSLILASWLTNKRIDGIERDLYGEEDPAGTWCEFEQFGEEEEEEQPEHEQKEGGE